MSTDDLVKCIHDPRFRSEARGCLACAYERLQREQDLAWSVIERYGVPKERGRTVHNAIEVLVTRMDRELAAKQNMVSLFARGMATRDLTIRELQEKIDAIGAKTPKVSQSDTLLERELAARDKTIETLREQRDSWHKQYCLASEREADCVAKMTLMREQYQREIARMAQHGIAKADAARSEEKP